MQGIACSPLQPPSPPTPGLKPSIATAVWLACIPISFCVFHSLRIPQL